MSKLLEIFEEGVFDGFTSSISRDSRKVGQCLRWIVDTNREKYSCTANKLKQILHTDTSHTGVVFRALPSCRT